MGQFGDIQVYRRTLQLVMGRVAGDGSQLPSSGEAWIMVT
jgi:hypothetical protein